MEMRSVVMKFEKSTKNTHKFSTGVKALNDVLERPFSELYIQKTAMPEPAKSIEVTVKW